VEPVGVAAATTRVARRGALDTGRETRAPVPVKTQELI
jgi:hypothetical protein